MEIKFKQGAIDDVEYWKLTGNKKIQAKISELLISIALTPEKGIGKPEKLKGNLSGFWSRRIDKEHRIVYKIDKEEQKVTIISLKGHY
jgi:toxin YoeB